MYRQVLVDNYVQKSMYKQVQTRRKRFRQVQNGQVQRRIVSIQQCRQEQRQNYRIEYKQRYQDISMDILIEKARMKKNGKD